MTLFLKQRKRKGILTLTLWVKLYMADSHNSTFYITSLTSQYYQMLPFSPFSNIRAIRTDSRVLEYICIDNLKNAHCFARYLC